MSKKGRTPFTLLGISLLKSNFRRDKIINYDKDNFNSAISINLVHNKVDEYTFESFFEFNIKFGIIENEKIETPEIEFDITYATIFKCDVELSSIDDDYNDFSNVSVPFIIYPFVREIVASTSLKANVKPIILELINFDKLVNEHTKIKKPKDS